EELESEVAKMSSIQNLLKAIDIEKLLESGVAQPPIKKRTFIDDSKSKGQTQPRKKRKIRLPKAGIDPEKQPDPERWLPLRDRSIYRAKSKKDKKKGKDLTQGGIVVEKDGEGEMIGGNNVTRVTPAQATAAAKNKNKKKGKAK